MNRPLRILIDARMLLGRFSGVARVVTNLVENLAAIPDVSVTALCGNEPYAPWAGRTDISMLVSDFSRGHRSPARRMLWEAVRLPRWIEKSGGDIWHATWNTGVPGRCPVPAVVTVHDVIPWHESICDFRSRVGRACYRRSLSSAIRRARGVVTVSGYSAQQLHRIAGGDPEKTRVIYNGVGVPTRPARSKNAEAAAPYVLYVGGHEDRKNVESVLAAMGEYWRSFDPGLTLRLTGRAENLTPAAAAEYARLSRDSRIVFLGKPDEDQLAREYAGATALLLLSRAEGFGLPVVEAMVHGCPVIAARCGSLPEIVGSAGVLVHIEKRTNAQTALAVAQTIHQIRSIPSLVDELVRSGYERASRFSWRRAAEAYLSEYWSAIRESKSAKSEVLGGAGMAMAKLNSQHTSVAS